jgi:hypothetical protein
MAIFKTQIEQLVGAITTASDMDDYLTATAREIIDLLPNELVYQYSAQQTFTDDLSLVGKKVVGEVTRNGIRAIPVPFSMSAKVADATSMHLATAGSPVFYLNGSTLTVKPDTGALGGATYLYTYEAFVNTESMSNYTTFPSNAEYALILGSAIKALQQKINVMIHTDEESELVAAVQVELQALNELYKLQLQQLGALKA